MFNAYEHQIKDIPILKLFGSKVQNDNQDRDGKRPSG